jgi:hypothetical protein
MSSTPNWERQDRMREAMRRAYCSPGAGRTTLGVEADTGRTAHQHAASIEHAAIVRRERRARAAEKRRELAENAQLVEQEEAEEAAILAMTPEEFDEYRKGRRGRYTETERALLKRFTNSRFAVEPETF